MGLPDLPAGVREGAVLAGKYRVERVLGAGGMGVVVAAHHVLLDEKVAIKLLLPQMLESPQAVSRFAREARAAVKIKSEHVARVFDVGQLEGGIPYMVMEYLEGGDLASWLRQRGPLAVPQAVEFVLQACEAIAEAHALGIIHRDLKPANIFCIRRPDGLLSVKVLDFGISKRTGDGSSMDLSATKKGAWVGSPLYMAPEQMQSASTVDARADIWAIGAILYELVCGSVPFDAETMPELVYAVVHASHLPLCRVCPEAPPVLESIVQRCLEKDRTKRYSNVGQLAVALSSLAPERSRGSVERVLRTIEAAGLDVTALSLPSTLGSRTPLTTSATAVKHPWTGTPEAPTRKRRTIHLAAALGVSVGVAASFVAFRVEISRRPATPSSLGGGIPPTPPGVGGGIPPTPPGAASASSPAPAESAATSVPIRDPAVDASPGDVAPPASASSPASSARSRPAASPRPPHSAAPKETPRCDPPYFFDDQGNRVFKKECL